ncbi:hypothetical protein ACHAXS_012511 [Conticribra weissflogii]
MVKLKNLSNLMSLSWYSKKQSTIEIHTSDTAFVATKAGIETLCGIEYRLCMIDKDTNKWCYAYLHL